MDRTKLIALPAILLIVTSTGVVGYSIIEGWGFFDSLYMTIITLSTTGFREVRDLSQGAGSLLSLSSSSVSAR